MSSSHSVALVDVVEDAFGNDFDPVLETGANALQRERFLAITPHRQGKSGTVVCVQTHRIPCPADRDVELLAVHQFGRAVGVHVYDNAIDSGALA
jgi:hypothetical protein